MTSLEMANVVHPTTRKRWKSGNRWYNVLLAKRIIYLLKIYETIIYRYKKIFRRVCSEPLGAYTIYRQLARHCSQRLAQLQLDIFFITLQLHSPCGSTNQMLVIQSFNNKNESKMNKRRKKTRHTDELLYRRRPKRLYKFNANTQRILSIALLQWGFKNFTKCDFITQPS